MLNSTTTNILWELDGYSAYSAGTARTPRGPAASPTFGPGGLQRRCAQFNGYTQGPGYYGKTFFLWPPDPRNGSITNTTTLKSYLSALGISSTTDQNTLAANWSTWLGQGTTTGLANLQNWLKGSTTSGGPYTTTTKFVTEQQQQGTDLLCRLPALQPGLSGREHTTARFPRTGGLASSARPTIPSCSTLPALGSARKLHLHDQLQRDPELDHPDAEPFPDAATGGPHQVLRLDPDGDHRDLAQLRQHRPAVLGRVHRPHARLQANVFGRVHGHQRHGRLRQRFHLGNRSHQRSPPRRPQYMSYTDNPLRPNLRYWFGPMPWSIISRITTSTKTSSNYFFMQPGDSYEAPIYTAKQAFLAAINTMQNNHPNDWFTVVPYSGPRSSATGHRAIQLRALPAGDELQLCDGRPLLSVSHHQRRRFARTTPRSLPTTPTRPPGRSPRPTSWTRRALTATPASPWPSCSATTSSPSPAHGYAH